MDEVRLQPRVSSINAGATLNRSSSSLGVGSLASAVSNGLMRNLSSARESGFTGCQPLTAALRLLGWSPRTHAVSASGARSFVTQNHNSSSQVRVGSTEQSMVINWSPIFGSSGVSTIEGFSFWRMDTLKNVMKVLSTVASLNGETGGLMFGCGQTLASLPSVIRSSTAGSDADLNGTVVWPP
ncbi:hypothetical protein NE237_007219 [Protea cynaroides]|uniref:Uncharacterized protein n=1 Tax=Protea cynaroides TaxID=273540 RepID=A0A9Q0KP15_9MAGN|nr:hypothetical protein NE237_007219 [Protea cynaroides]